MGLISELRRRNVLRMVVLYAVAAWLTMQVAGTLIDLANLPDWVGPIVLSLLAIGFPIALVFSWFFEVTPQGISREKEVAPAESVSHASGRWLDFLVISLLLAAVLLFAYDKWWVSGPPERSIAVLPFVSMNPEIESVDVLSKGIQDDLITKLSKIGELKVVSRTSVERYRNTDISMGRIGEELGVSKILEGGVQRIGNQIRVNVQLIDSATDDHLWANTFDRSLTATNFFAIQTEIVETIARHLDANLPRQGSPEPGLMPTKNLDAYTAYLRGKNQADGGSMESVTAAIESFETAISLDPNFAQAFVGLADAYLMLGGLSTAEKIALAEPPLVKAFELNSSLGEAYATLGMLRQRQGNQQAAEKAFDNALSLQPNNPRVFYLYGQLRRAQDKREEALELFQKAMNLDPYSAPVNFAIAQSFDSLGRSEEALARYRRVVEIEPRHAGAYIRIGAINYTVFGRADESLVWYQKAEENDALNPGGKAVVALVYLELGDTKRARQSIDRGDESGSGNFWVLWSRLLHNLYIGRETAAQADAQALLEDNPQFWGALWLLRNIDIAAGRLQIARARYARVFPELVDPDDPEVNASNYFAAVDLALVLIRLGEKVHADRLLKNSLDVISTMPRLGLDGYWITDVRIFALQQRPRQALEALRQAIDDGWGFFIWLYLDHDPNLESIRAEPEFRRLHSELKEEIMSQAERVQELRASGDL